MITLLLKSTLFDPVCYPIKQTAHRLLTEQAGQERNQRGTHQGDTAARHILVGQGAVSSFLSFGGGDAYLSIADGLFVPEYILQELLGDMELAVLDRMAVSFKCRCSKERFARGIARIKKSDIQEMIDAGENIETCCQFCNSKYEIGRAHV